MCPSRAINTTAPTIRWSPSARSIAASMACVALAGAILASIFRFRRGIRLILLVQPPDFPRQDHLAKDHRVRPSGGAAAHMSAGRIDPRLTRLASAVDEQIEVRDRHLRVARSPDDADRRCRLAEQALRLERHLREKG